MKRGYCDKRLPLANADFRRVLDIGEHLQLVLMKDGIVQSTKADAEARHDSEEWDGGTTE